jgi:hypothetical protein
LQPWNAKCWHKPSEPMPPSESSSVQIAAPLLLYTKEQWRTQPHALARAQRLNVCLHLRRLALHQEMTRNATLHTLAHLRLKARDRVCSVEVVRSMLLWATALRMQRVFSSWRSLALGATSHSHGNLDSMQARSARACSCSCTLSAQDGIQSVQAMAEHLAALEYDNILLQRSVVASAKRERAAAAAATLRCVLRASQRLALALSWGRWMSVVAAISTSERRATHSEEAGSGGRSHISPDSCGSVVAALSVRGQGTEHHDGGASPVDIALGDMPGSMLTGGDGDAPRRPPLHPMDSTMSALSLAHDTELLWPPSQPWSRALSRSPSLGRAAMRKAQR